MVNERRVDATAIRCQLCLTPNDKSAAIGRLVAKVREKGDPGRALFQGTCVGCDWHMLLIVDPEGLVYSLDTKKDVEEASPARAGPGASPTAPVEQPADSVLDSWRAFAGDRESIGCGKESDAGTGGEDDAIVRERLSTAQLHSKRALEAYEAIDFELAEQHARAALLLFDPQRPTVSNRVYFLILGNILFTKAESALQRGAFDDAAALCKESMAWHDLVEMHESVRIRELKTLSACLRRLGRLPEAARAIARCKVLEKDRELADTTAQVGQLVGRLRDRFK